MVQPAIRHNHLVIDLVSDEDDDDFTDDEPVLYNARSIGEPTDDDASFGLDNLHAYEQTEIDTREIIDLTAIPDIDVPPSGFSPHVVVDAEPANDRGEIELITEAGCLQLVLDIFPAVSVNHVLTLIRERTTDLTRTKQHSEQIANELLEGIYPKEADAASKKRRRADSDGVSDYENDECGPRIPSYDTDAANLLKDEFLNVPARHITNILRQHKTLFKAYITLEQQVRNYQRIARAFVKPARPRNKRGIELVLIERGSQLPKELRAAKKKIENEAAKRRKAEEQERAEEVNLQRARMTNQMGECQCCFTECPLNRMISCSDEDLHLFCMDCPKSYIETEMGQSKCRPVCFANTECKGTFTREQLQRVLSDKTFERLEHMQQQQDLAAAGLDFLSECPFCDFKAECPPVDVDREFRCQSTKCGKTSCRLCNRETHIPLGCEEARKDGQLTLRHIVEEAMSAALIRKCNSCQHPFVKDYGCNKMTCSHCGNKQCYICSKNVNNYDHFGDVNKGRCPLHNNVEDVHEQAVKKAADEAMSQVKAENPDLSDADLMVQVSDRVKQAEAARRGRAADRVNEFPYELLRGQLVNGPGFLGVVPPPPRAVARPPPRPLGRIGDILGAAHNGLAAAAVQLPGELNLNASVQPLPQPQVQARAHRYFLDPINPPERIDEDAQAAHNQLQLQLQEANRAHNANGHPVGEQDVQAQARRKDEEIAVRRRRVQEIEEWYHELRRRRRQDLGARPPQPAPDLAGPMPYPHPVPWFGLGGPLANAGHAGAGAAVGARLAFGGFDANRALDVDGAARRREMNRWFEEQLRNVPRQ